MTADPYAAYLARGGSITKCPPGAASYGFSPNCPSNLLVSEFHTPEPTRAYVKPERPAPKPKMDVEGLRALRAEALQRGREVQQRKTQARRAQIIRDWERLKSVSAMSEKHGVGVKRMRDLLREAGIKVQRATRQQAAPKPPPQDKIKERDAKVIAMLNSGAPVQQVSDAFGITERTVRRIAHSADLPPRITNARTTDEATRRAIGEAYAAGGVKMQALADRFGVSWDVVRGACKKYGGKA